MENYLIRCKIPYRGNIIYVPIQQMDCRGSGRLNTILITKKMVEEVCEVEDINERRLLQAMQDEGFDINYSENYIKGDASIVIDVIDIQQICGV